MKESKGQEIKQFCHREKGFKDIIRWRRQTLYKLGQINYEAHY
jgi:hypothetical protein